MSSWHSRQDVTDASYEEPYMQSGMSQAVAMQPQQQLAPQPQPQQLDPDASLVDCSFMAAPITRENEELQRRRLEHVESWEHIAPQQTYPQYGSRVGR